MMSLSRRQAPRGLTRQKALQLLGLEERRSFWGVALPGVGLLGAGALLGAGTLMLFAPGLLSQRMERAQR